MSTASARWLAAPDYPIGIPLEHLEAIIDGVSKGWGTTEFAAASFPSRANDPVFLSWIAKFTRTMGGATSIRAAFRSLLACDVRAALPYIRCPVLLMHAQDNAFMPADHSRYIAEHIPDARLEIFSGGDMNVQYEHEEAVLGLLEDFLTGGNRPAASERVLATVLFTDIVGSTQRAATMGDSTWHALLKQHDEIATAVTERFGGRIVKLTRDGVLATFTGPGRAIGCAQALIDALARLDLQIKAGAHTCEIEIRDGGDIAGIDVHVGARIMEHAGPGEVLVSRTVRDLVSGSDVTFADRGTHALKGVPNEWACSPWSRPHERVAAALLRTGHGRQRWHARTNLTLGCRCSSESPRRTSSRHSSILR